MLLEQKLATNLTAFQTAQLDTDRNRLLANIYKDALKLSEIIARKKYRGLPEYVYEDVSHETATAIVCSVHNKPLLEINSWYFYIEMIAQYKVMDMFRSSTYFKQFERLDDVIGDPEEEAFHRQVYRRFDVPFLHVLVPELITGTAQQLLSLVSVVKYETKLKRNIIFNLAVKSLTSDTSLFTERLDPFSQSRINLLVHFMKSFIRTTRDELYSY